MRLREILVDGAGTVEPKPPLTPEEARREAQRKVKVNKRIQDAQSACAKRLRELRSKL